VRRLVRRLSADADLTVLGFTLKQLTEQGADCFGGYHELKDVIDISAAEKIVIE
jgi:hypothetical protein